MFPYTLLITSWLLLPRIDAIASSLSALNSKPPAATTRNPATTSTCTSPSKPQAPPPPSQPTALPITPPYTPNHAIAPFDERLYSLSFAKSALGATFSKHPVLSGQPEVPQPEPESVTHPAPKDFEFEPQTITSSTANNTDDTSRKAHSCVKDLPQVPDPQARSLAPGPEWRIAPPRPTAFLHHGPNNKREEDEATSTVTARVTVTETVTTTVYRSINKTPRPVAGRSIMIRQETRIPSQVHAGRRRTRPVEGTVFDI